jgi:hypothetical protein
LQWPLPQEMINCPLQLPLRRPNSELWPDYSSWDSLTHTVLTRDNLPNLVGTLGSFLFRFSRSNLHPPIIRCKRIPCNMTTHTLTVII